MAKSYLEMSDEELANMDLASLPPAEEAKEEQQEEVKDEEGTSDVDAGEARPEQSDPEPSESKQPDADDDDSDEADPQPDTKLLDKAEEKKEPAKAEPEAKDKPVEEVKEEKPVEVDYKAVHDKLFAPFKANGKEIAVSSVEDAISLMQMGANYTKKMAALKPNLKLLKLLENNGLLSEEKISYLIDLEKKSPEAISKLIKDSGIDPMDIDAEKAGGYKPKTYTVNDKELELDAVLDEIQGTSSYARTLDIVGTKWDAASKQVFAETPQLLKVINDHVNSGIYDTIMQEVDRERMFGRLTGLSDLEAYKKVGDAIHARGGFAPKQQEKPVPVKQVVTPKPNKVDEDKLREKRRAAGSTKPAVSSSTTKDFNPLSMSDEEFSKSILEKYV